MRVHGRVDAYCCGASCSVVTPMSMNAYEQHKLAVGVPLGAALKQNSAVQISSLSFVFFRGDDEQITGWRRYYWVLTKSMHVLDGCSGTAPTYLTCASASTQFRGQAPRPDTPHCDISFGRCREVSPAACSAQQLQLACTSLPCVASKMTCLSSTAGDLYMMPSRPCTRGVCGGADVHGPMSLPAVHLQ